jgi:hypothetical protein
MADTSVPIVSIHRGACPYQPFVLGQAESASPESAIIVIGDQSSRSAPPMVRVSIEDFWHDAARLEPLYRSVCPRPTDGELFCLSRWFVLRDFMRTTGVERVFHLESDVMLYADVNEEERNWSQYDMTMVRSCFGGSMFVNGLAGLDDLCQTIWAMFDGPDAAEKLRNQYSQEEYGGHACETAALRSFYNTHRNRTGEMGGSQPDGSYWDFNIGQDEGFEMRDGAKHFRFFDGKPQCKHLASGRNIRFNTLHFQGMMKSRIEAAFRQLHPTTINAAA